MTPSNINSALTSFYQESTVVVLACFHLNMNVVGFAASVPSVVMFPEKMELELMWRRKLHLRCSASGRPIPRVVWMKDGNEVTPGGRLQIKNFTLVSSAELMSIYIPS
jgi:hypothetical protein